MRTKLEGNGLWESSRMMLPKHVQAIRYQDHELKRRVRKELDLQEWEEVSRALMSSHQLRQAITVYMYDEFEQLKIVGVVERLDSMKGFLVDGEWFKIEDIERAYIEI